MIAGLRAVGASDAQASSGLLILCIIVGLGLIVFAIAYRMPISIAWSTPGAALLVAAGAAMRASRELSGRSWCAARLSCCAGCGRLLAAL